ncbi:sugar ABC transporter substrate-binding protein [Agromyces luteolus]|uniref:Extracellular solute-binding protein n=1 Tax=Agromyces luteolus TaxID=88373 RepID=A0A7C9M0U0_9MICO|nr:extracellular solute-binding protein [Agromyces luteolus]MUN08633.1 extracellular solute-binding protein [Agromyces luteolus]GLK27173.1 sugar ABC transporter substrate-binding protein [Agromyces luteolus]
MHSRKIIAALAATAAFALLLTGCGRADTGVNTDTASDVVIDDSPATGTIEVWAMGTEGELLEQLTAQFEEANPDATVNVTAVPWSDYMTKIQTAVASGQTPDATMVGTTDLAAAVDAGALAPVPDDLIDYDEFFAGAAQGTEVARTRYAVPWYVETRVLFYRGDLAEEAGLEPPTTWEEQTEFFGALQGNGSEWGTTLFTGAPNSYQFVLPYLWQAGAEIINEDGTEWTFDTPEAEEGLAYYQSLITDGYADANGPVNIGEIEPDIVNGSVASIVSGPWESSLLVAAGGEDFYNDQISVAPLPSGPAGNVSWVGGAGLGVFADAENPEGAWKLLRWLSEPEVQQQWFDISFDLPSVASAWDYPAIADNPMYAVMREQMDNTNTPPAVTTWPQVYAAFDAQIERVAAGTATPAEALAALQAEAESIGTGN